MKKIKSKTTKTDDRFSKENLMKSDQETIAKYSHIRMNISESDLNPEYITVEEFIRKARQVHGYKYDYSQMFRNESN